MWFLDQQKLILKNDFVRFVKTIDKMGRKEKQFFKHFDPCVETTLIEFLCSPEKSI